MPELIKKEIEVAKETSEVFTAVAELIKDIKAGKQVGDLVNENLGNVMNAVSGFDKIPEELKSEAVYSTIGFGVGEVAKALIDPVAE